MLTEKVIDQPHSTHAGSAVRAQKGGGQEVDLLGIGFGPSNLALAIALEEARAASPDRAVPSAAFVEAKPQFGWHDGMLLPETTMQISFLKDLVSLRSPTSRYSFLSYLHARNRLADFINMKTFFPTRREFHDYLNWAAAQVQLPVSYGTRAMRIEWRGGGFEITTEHRTGTLVTQDTIRAQRLVVGAGIRPVLPQGVSPGPRVFHNHQLLDHLAALPSRPKGRFLVVGSGQSAAEVAAYLHDSYPEAEVHASFRRFGYSPSDDTPYANRIFDPASVDDFYTAPQPLKTRLRETHLATNYSAVDGELIEALYRREYDEKITGRRRLYVHRVTEVARQQAGTDGVSVTLRDLGDRHQVDLEVDAVIYATGFAPFDLRGMLGATLDVSAAYDGDLPRVARDYSLELPGLERRIYLNGGVEHSHGMTSSLLSNVAVRASDILRSALTDQASPVPA